MPVNDDVNLGPRRAVLWACGLGAAVLTAVVVVAGMNRDGWAMELSILAVDRLVRVLPVVLGFMVASIGMGWWWTPITRAVRARTTVCAALGFGTMLTLIHGFGAVGLLVPAVVWGLMIAGVISLGLWIGRERAGLAEFMAGVPGGWSSACWFAAVPAVGVLLAASVSMPGILWDTEFGGYDSLSYHYPLAREWVLDGRIWPAEHSVYSYLPSYLESAFAGLGVLIAGGGDPMTPSGSWLSACQLLHAAVTLGAGITIARLVVVAGGSGFAGAVAGGLTIATPWSVVVGSLAYNEMGVVWLGAAGVLVAMQRELGPMLRGGLTGLLIAFACGCKPTAIFMVAPVAGVMLLFAGSWRGRTVAVGAAMLLGAVGVAPWLVRNALDTGNPVFPQLAGVFGTGHWSTEQAARFAEAHVFRGSLGDRFRLVLFVDPTDPAGARHRGLMHPQWFWLFPLVSIAAVVLVARSSLAERLLVVGLVIQLGAWLALTHVQSRFLLPCLVTAAPIIGLAFDRLTTRWHARSIGGAAVVLAFSVATLGVWSRQNDGRPSIGIAMDGLTARQPDLPIEQRSARALMHELPADSRVLLVGSATPLYDPANVIYATTWDASPLTRLIDAGTPASDWSGELRGSGVTHVFVDVSELRRLEGSGWAAPGLTVEAVEAWLRIGTRPVAISPRLQQVLAEVVP